MRDRKIETFDRATRPHFTASSGEAEKVFRAVYDPIAKQTTPLREAAKLEENASTLKRISRFKGSRVDGSLLRLQQQHGNRYVQRVLALARSESESPEVDPAVEAAIERSRAGGQSLDSGVRRQLESAFGANFKDVRIHTGDQANALNESLGALAFTTGKDIFFSNGQYDPGSRGGRELLAHELTHVLQQSGSQLQGKMEVGAAGDEFEREADQVARAVSNKIDRLSAGNVHSAPRSCACGKHSASGGECEECRAKHSHSSSEAQFTIDPTNGANHLSRANTLDSDEDVDTVVIRNFIQCQADGDQQDGDGQQNQVGTATSHCTPTASFGSIPSGALTAAFVSGKFGVPFTMVGNFNAPVPCNCVCGEYRQFVRGFFKYNGTTLTHALCSNTMDPTTWNEDCVTAGGTDLKYGYHSIPFATSKFSNPDQATGCTFNGFDFPGFKASSLSSGDTVQMHLEFQGKLVDACNGDAQLAASSWTVDGTGTAP
ncbi:MAG: DUF4157 domain-containing protein [Acidobacteriaceae bacterium]|nr:DUF4157 domain-containing protein [Acidobacteriaceae bacterium]MBV9778567.1 DUF4157 domain-containing protein [Acidobacteriaceae bacterium]